MGFRVVDKSTMSFETDLPPHLRGIHPSGMLHAFGRRAGATLLTAPSKGDTIEIDCARFAHTFAWISNSLYIETVLIQLEQLGYDRAHGIVFIPYSTKKNWIERYPQAAPSLEYTDDNKTKFYKNPWCTSPPKKTKVKEGLKGLKWGESVKVPDVAGQRGSATAAAANNNQNSASSGPNDKVEDGKKDGLPKKRKRIDRRKNRRRTLNILRDNTFIADPDRDELHLEIWNYFVWFHARMAKVEEEQNLKDEAESSKADSTNTNGSDDEDEENDDSQNEEDEDEDNGGDTNAKKKPAKKWKQKSPRKRPTNGVNLVELKNMIEKLEDAFLIIHNTKHELVWVDPPKKPPLTLKRGASGRVQDLSDKGKTEEGGDEKKEEEEPEQRKRITVEEAAITRKTAPFLEEALAAALRQLVLTRPHVDGKPKRRSRKQPRMRSANRKKQMDWFDRGRGAKPRQFDEMYEKLAQFREKHGHCKVSKNDMDRDLAHWVRGIREKRARMRREQGIEVEVIPPGEELLARSLTQERIDRLDAIGFAWTVAKPGSKRSWEERFQELLVYYEEHGAWPSQSMVGLGSWLHKQRQAYTRQEPKFMKEKYQLLDDVGFEWTPRGNTRMSWDEGFEMLLEYGRENGHFQVQNPGGDKKSDEYRFYKWVESLHHMYRSYKLGRQSGSLNDERVVLLIKHGFVFREF